MTENKKMGRPKAENPKNHDMKVRLDDVMYNALQNYCSEHGVKPTEAVRTAINLLTNKKGE